MSQTNRPTVIVPARRFVAMITAFLLLVGWQFGSAATALADGPTSFANTTSIAIPATGSPNQIGPASPYPSNVTVSGMTGLVTKVTVTFHNLTHSILNDVDALLVAPTGANMVVLSDASAENTFTFASDATITLDDDAAAAFPSSGRVATGTYRPVNNPVGPADSFPSPAPTPSNQTTFAGAFAGINPNGQWQLFIVDDTTGDLGDMSGGWSLSVTTEASAVATTTTVTSSHNPSTTGSPVTFSAAVRVGATPVTAGTVQFSSDGSNLGTPVPLNGSGIATLTTSALAEGTHLIRATYGGATGFLTSNATISQRVDNATVVTDTTYCNTGVITVPNAGTATPYPSNIFVTGLTGRVTKVTAQLKGLSHSAPIDLDVLLSGPTPAKNLFLMSDSGGQNPASNVNLTFDDAAAGPIGNSLASGTYRPTRTPDESTENMPAPAPALSGATELSTFNGASGNGTWSLWILDDATGDAGSISGGWCVTITSAVPTTTTLIGSPNPSTAGQPVTLTATVTSDGNPVTSGTVQFSDGATDLGAAVPVDGSGRASLTTSALSVGTHTIKATYGGTATLGDSSDTVDQVVDKVPTTTTLTSAPNPSTVGETVVFTATVTSAGGPASEGTVTFTSGGVDLAVVPLDASGQATTSTNSLLHGTRAIEARYSGTTSLAASVGRVDQVINRLDSTTTLTSDLNPSTVGAQVTFTATVTSAEGPATAGTVTFSIDGTDQVAVPVSAAGQVTLSTSSLTAGTHTIGATFSGSPSLDTSSATTLDQVVGQAASTTTLTSTPNPASFGATVTFTATITAGGAPVTSGTVQFSVGGTPVGPAMPVQPDGTATLTQAGGLLPGTFTMTATFSGTSQVAGSSGTVVQVISARPTTTVVTGPPSSDLGTEVTFTATVASAEGAVTSGLVVFSLDGVPVSGDVGVDASGQATYTTSDIPFGDHTVSATYTDPDGGYESSSGNLRHSVSMTADARGPYTVAEGGSLTLDATGSPGGTFGWDLNGDGDYSDATGLNPTLTWDQLEALGINDGPSAHQIRLRISSGNASDAVTATLNVTNTAPDSILTGDLTATVGEPFTIKVGADDPSSADMAAMFTYTVDWGDGSPVETETGPADPPVTHTYTRAGNYNATFTAQDKDGGTGPGTSVQVTVEANASPSPSPSPTSTGDSDDNHNGNGDSLPQTGANADPDLLIMGLGLAGVGALVTVGGLIGRSHRRRG